MSQPEWELIGQLGDENPIDYDGLFVYRDKTGVYCEEAEVLEVTEKSPDGEPKSWTVWRVVLDRCTFINGVLSDNEFHPESPAWFASYLPSVARSLDLPPQELIEDLSSEDALKRAWAYEAIWRIVPCGITNFDESPLTFTSREEVRKRYDL